MTIQFWRHDLSNTTASLDANHHKADDSAAKIAEQGEKLNNIKAKFVFHNVETCQSLLAPPQDKIDEGDVERAH